MKKYFFLLIFILLYVNLFAENYLINGGQSSIINYQMVQKVEPKPAIKNLYLTYVKPASFKILGP